MWFILIMQVTEVAHKCQLTHCGTEIIDFAVWCFYEGNFPYSPDILKEKVSQNIQYSSKALLSQFGGGAGLDCKSAFLSGLSTR